MSKNKFECPECGKRAEKVYESKDGETLGIQCTAGHLTPRKQEGRVELVNKYTVFLIKLTPHERDLYRDGKLHLRFKDYQDRKGSV